MTLAALRPRARRADGRTTTTWCSPACCARTPTTGRVRTIDGKPQAFYQLNDLDAANLQRGVSLLSELLFAAGAKRIMLPFHGAADLCTPDDARRLLDQRIPAEWLGGASPST